MFGHLLYEFKAKYSQLDTICTFDGGLLNIIINFNGYLLNLSSL